MASWSLGENVLQRDIENGKLLVEKATDGDVEGVRSLLLQRVRVNAEAYNLTLYYKSKNYRTPLHHAATGGHVEVLRLLITDGAELDAVDMFGMTALHLAAENGHVCCVSELLEAGASCNMATAYKRPQWVSSTVYPHVSDTRPLHLAAKNNHLACIRQLMLYGADYNAVDALGRTSMFIAAELGHEEAVLVHLHNAYGKTILSLPVKDTESTALHECVMRGKLAAVNELLSHGSDVNYRNHLGMSPLHLALQCPVGPSTFDIIGAIITRGFNTDINLPDMHGTTPVEYVCFKGFRQDRRPDIAAFLIAYGAQFMHVKNVRGCTVLQQELNSGSEDYVILRAIVKTIVHLPSLRVLGIRGPGMPGPPALASRFENALANTSFVRKCDWYRVIASSVRSLQHHCRVAVRSQLGARRLRYIRHLPLPLSLQDYLLLDFDEYR